MGNGAISDNSPVSPQLNYALLKTISHEACVEVYPFLEGRKSVVCAASNPTEAFQSVCFGDRYNYIDYYY